MDALVDFLRQDLGNPGLAMLVANPNFAFNKTQVLEIELDHFARPQATKKHESGDTEIPAGT